MDEDEDEDDDDDDDGYFHERLPVHGQVMVGFPAHSAVDTGGYIFRGFWGDPFSWWYQPPGCWAHICILAK